MSFADLLRVPPGTTPDLEAIDTRATPSSDADKEGARERIKDLRAAAHPCHSAHDQPLSS